MSTFGDTNDAGARAVPPPSLSASPPGTPEGDGVQSFVADATRWPSR